MSQRGSQQHVLTMVYIGRQKAKLKLYGFIKNMEKKGWLTREACQTDKRAFEVDLTDEGRRIIQAAIPPHQRAIEETFSVLTPEEQAQLVELLKKFKNV